jgi:hypothetical protein
MRPRDASHACGRSWKNRLIGVDFHCASGVCTDAAFGAVNRIRYLTSDAPKTWCINSASSRGQNNYSQSHQALLLFVYEIWPSG